jgi:pyruvate dehydrogenase E1 component alpha subunit
VDETVHGLLAMIRAGGGPRFLLCRTYRLTGHTGADPAPYRSKEEVEIAWGRDPLARVRDVLTTAGVPGSEIARAEQEARTEIDRAFDAAKASPFPPLTRAFADVQDVGDPRQGAF